MSDIFLAYSLDTETPTGERWRDHIERQLKQCHLLVVLWSKTSAGSEYVKEGADIAKEQDKLYPEMITKCSLLYGFRGYQTLNMTAWRGDLKALVWRRIVTEIRKHFDSA